MIGGKIIEVKFVEDRVWLDVQDTTYPKDFCAIYVVRNEDSERIRPHDFIWWQGKNAFWTREDRSIVEKVIPRAGYSGVDVPDNYFEETI